jgi:hypothetical protein
VSEFVTSIDAVNVRPPIGPYYDPRAPDWAHFDCARYGCVFECVQVRTLRLCARRCASVCRWSAAACTPRVREPP